MEAKKQISEALKKHVKSAKVKAEIKEIFEDSDGTIEGFIRDFENFELGFWHTRVAEACGSASYDRKYEQLCQLESFLEALGWGGRVSNHRTNF